MHAHVADILADVAANAIEAHAARIVVALAEVGDWLTLTVSDDGPGMPPETAARAFDPFFTDPAKHAGRRVGLGLPFVRQTCEACGGAATLASAPGKGTTVTCTFRRNAVDLPPMGDIAGAVRTLMAYPGDFELVFSHTRDAQGYTIARGELCEAVGDFASVGALALAGEFLRSQEDALA